MGLVYHLGIQYQQSISTGILRPVDASTFMGSFAKNLGVYCIAGFVYYREIELSFR